MSTIVKTASVRVMLSAMESIFKACGLNPETQQVLIHSAPGKKSFDFSVLAANGLFRYKMPCIRNSMWENIRGVAFFGKLAHCVESFSCMSGKIEWSQENTLSFGDTICCRLRVHGQVSEHRFPCRYLILPIPEEKEFARKMTLPFRRNSLLPALGKLNAFLEESGVPLAEQRISVCPKSCSLSAMSKHEVLDLHLPEMTFNKGRLTFILPSVAPFLKAVQATRLLQEAAQSPSRICILKKAGKPASYVFEVESCSWCWRGPVRAMRAPVWTKLRPTREQLLLQVDLSQRGFKTLRHFLVSVRGEVNCRQLELVSCGKRAFRIQAQGDERVSAIVRADILGEGEFRIPFSRDFLHRAVLLKQTSFQIWKNHRFITCGNGFGRNVYALQF